MDSEEILFFILIVFSLLTSAVASQHNTPLDYSSFEPEQVSIYSGNSTSATLNYTVNTEYDNCTLATDRSSLPLGWQTSEPKTMDINSTGHYQVKTPEITAVEYPKNSTIEFNLDCQSPKSRTTIPLELDINLENPSNLPYSVITRNTPYILLTILITGLLVAKSSKFKQRLLRKSESSSKIKAKKLSQRLIRDLQERDFTPPDVKEKVSKAQEKIQNEDYEDAVKLMEEADQELDRT